MSNVVSSQTMEAAPVAHSMPAQVAMDYVVNNKKPGWTPMAQELAMNASDGSNLGPYVAPFRQVQTSSPLVTAAWAGPTLGMPFGWAANMFRGPQQVIKDGVPQTYRNSLGQTVPKMDGGSLPNRGLRGVSSFLGSSPVQTVANVVADINPYIAYKGYKNTKNYISSGRVADQSVGVFSTKRWNKVAHMNTLVEVREAIPFKNSVELSRSVFEKTSAPNFRNIIKSLRGIDNAPSETKALKGILNNITEPPELPPTFGMSTLNKLKDYTVNDRQGLPKTIALLGLGIPAASLGLNAADKVTEVISDKYNSLLSNKRFGNALDRALESPDVQFEISRGSDTDGIIGKLRSEFKVLNKYAPTVAKDPNLGSAFLESMVYRHAASGSAQEYMNNVKAFADLESRIKMNKPTMSHQGLRNVL